ncbi:retron system putative HNH endonuclease [Polyangium spumosum]|uniref:TIGR02646 family protein n=1 Tax=Polyangium spumosum TaxID=889282 RepID=A0A6N7PP92_9BACT|nr:retron system putative HNH endonuclease [Polyangium spumosum]MRG91944.1 TIGR02646 family protein [Polyangium spumosum]
MLRFAKGAAPKVLTGWQATPGADWESLSATHKDDVRDALLRDQGELCAYCQRRIPTKDGYVKVEHWHAQSAEEEAKGTLRWLDMLGVCLGDEAQETGAKEGERHCDTARGNKKLFLHPVAGRGPDPREHLRYTSEGEVLPSTGTSSARVQSDIDALNLNATRLKRARREIFDALRERLDKRKFTTAALNAEYKAAGIQPGVQSPTQCEVVRYHLRRWARQKNVELGG